MLIPIKPYIGSFSVRGLRVLPRKEFVYELFFEAVLGTVSDTPFVVDNLSRAKEIAQNFFNKVDDCAYGGKFEFFNKDGSYVNTPCFLVRVEDKVGLVDKDLNVLIDIEYEEIIPPIRTSKPLFVLKNSYKEWLVIDARNQSVLVKPGKYYKIWGYDQNHALVSTAYERELSEGTKRAIIDIHGRIVYKSDTYINIYPFYGTGVDYIIIQEKPKELHNGTVINNNLAFRRKDFPQNGTHPDNEIIEAPRNINYIGPIVNYDIMDAYEGDPDALWNTD